MSYARAKLPDFCQLSQKVCVSRGVSENDTTHRLLKDVPKLERRTGATGLLSLDRIFGALERELGTLPLERKVSEALKPTPNVDLSAHQILLDLATTPDNKVQLVTTNFYRLFTDCNPELEARLPPNFPAPLLPGARNGIIYLDGRATEDYRQSESSGPVLSRSAFGRAYLTDGWATDFFKKILSKYLVVFVGYATDDPPINYLLVALNAKGENLEEIYAFQSGRDDMPAGIRPSLLSRFASMIIFKIHNMSNSKLRKISFKKNRKAATVYSCESHFDAGEYCGE